MLKKVQNRIRRARRTRAQIGAGTREVPRLSVFRSNTHIYAQVIDDSTSTTLCSANDMAAKSGTKSERAKAVGEALAKAMQAQGIKACVFDRGGYLYHGRVKALAEAVREAGIAF